MNKIRKGDEVIVITGKDKGKRGTVLRMIPDEDRVVVEGVNVVKKTPEAESHAWSARRDCRENPLCPRFQRRHLQCGYRQSDRVGIKVLEDGKKVRVFKSNGEVVNA